MLSAAAPAKRRCLDGLRVLVVDDDEDVRDAVLAVLELYGAEVVAAEGADGARARLAALPFDVLLSDIEMPSEDGYSLIRSVRSSSAAGIAAAAVTGRAAPDERARAIAAGFNRVVGKPVDFEGLIDAVCALAGRAH
jgi:CheY-like chemotaxis protein